MDNKKRCKWCNLKNPLYIKYHDSEWCFPSFDDKYLYEMLLLESFQAGLSWECVLNKRENFRKAYDGFDIEKVISYDTTDTEIYANATSATTATTATTATKATQDSAGQQINTTYIKGLSVSGKTITYTKGNGSTGTITTQDTNTTYSSATSSTLGLVKLKSASVTTETLSGNKTLTITDSNVGNIFKYTLTNQNSNYTLTIKNSSSYHIKVFGVAGVYGSTTNFNNVTEIVEKGVSSSIGVGNSFYVHVEPLLYAFS